MKIPIVNRDDYVIFIEYFNDAYWAHTDVFRWSANVKKAYLKDLDQLQEMIGETLYGLSEKKDKKLIKFGESSGFKYLKEVKADDCEYCLYARSL
jgi:hypothetical protein